MTTQNSPLLPRSMSLSTEDAFAEVAKMTNVEKKEEMQLTVYSGTHPEWGNIHIVIPPAGSSMSLLPFAIRDF